MPLMKTLKDKKRKRENQKQKTQADLNRESGQRLRRAMQNAEMSVSGLENKESRKVFKSILQTFAQYLDEANTIASYDVAEIDQLLLEMTTLFEEALKNGDLDTAKRSVECIHTALLECRRELNEVELNRQDEVLAGRLDNLGKYKAVLETSRSVFLNRRNVITKEKEYLQLMDAYEELFKKVDKQIETRPDLYDQLNSLRPGIDKVPEEAQSLDTDLANLTLMADQVDDLKSAMAIFRKEYNAQISALKSLEATLSVQKGLLSEEVVQQMNDAIERYHEQLNEAILEAERLEELQEKRHQGITQIMSSMAVGKSTMKHTRKYEELRRRREAKQEGEAKGRQIEQELEHEHETMLTH